MKIDEIIGKYFLGKESKEELEILQAWKMESEENLAAISELETYWKNYDKIKDYKDFDKTNAWDTISGQLDNTATVEKVDFPLWKIAAGLIILFGAFYFIKTDRVESADVPTLVEVAEITEKSLVDGSQIWLNTNTRADLSNFSANDRKLELLEGEAYFDVVSDKTNPFEVKAGDFNIEVVGTEFNVKYKETEIEIYVNEGRVLVTNGIKKVYLGAGDRITGNSDTFSKTPKANPNISSWKTRTLEFNNAQLTEVVQDLSKHFAVDIKIAEGLNHQDCFLNTSFSQENLEDVLSELKILFQINSHKSGNTIVIDKVNC